MSEKASHTCIRCGYVSMQAVAVLRSYSLRDPINSKYCLDCRGAEKSRTRDNNVPLDAILEAVRELKGK